MIYPKWLPRPKSWLRAIALLFYNIPVLLGIGIFSRYYQVYGFPLFVGDEMHIPYYIGGAIVTVFGLSCLIFASLYHLFWGKPDPNPKYPHWLLPRKSLKQGLKMAIASLICYVGSIVVLLPFINFYYNHEDNFIVANIIIWVILASYCYHLKSNQLPTK